MKSLSSTHIRDGLTITKLKDCDNSDNENSTNIEHAISASTNKFDSINDFDLTKKIDTLNNNKDLVNDKSDTITNSKSSPAFDSVIISKNVNIVKRVKETNKIKLSYDPVNKLQKLNQFEILKEIGVGAHSKVKLGYDLVYSRPIAIKIMNRKERKRINFTFEKNFKIRNEINILNICNNHPNIIKLFEVLDDFKSRKIYLILEYCSLGELKWCRDNTNELQVKGPPQFSFQRSREIIRDVILGLEFLHLNNIIHRDIKPANLLVNQNGIVKISDFSISVILNNNSEFATSRNTFVDNGKDDFVKLIKNEGTPAFFAPEVCLGTEIWDTFSIAKTDDNDSNYYITFAVDVWALGVTAFCILFGRLPFTSKYDLKLFEKIVNKPLKKPDFTKLFQNNISNIVSLIEFELAMDFLNELMVKNPMKRKSIVELKNHAFICFDFNNNLPYDNRTKDVKLQEKLKFLAVQSLNDYKKLKYQDHPIEKQNITDFLTTIETSTDNNNEISLDLSDLNLKDKLKSRESEFKSTNSYTAHSYSQDKIQTNSKVKIRSKAKSRIKNNLNGSKGIDNHIIRNTSKNNEVSLPINSSFASLDSFYVETFAMTKLNENNHINVGSFGNKFKSSSTISPLNDLPTKKRSHISIKNLTSINNDSDNNKFYSSFDINTTSSNSTSDSTTRRRTLTNESGIPSSRIPKSQNAKINISRVISNTNTNNPSNNHTNINNTDIKNEYTNNVNFSDKKITNKNITNPKFNNKNFKNTGIDNSNVSNSLIKRNNTKSEFNLIKKTLSQEDFKAGSFKIKTGNFFTSNSNSSNSSLSTSDISKSNSSYDSDSQSGSYSSNSSSSYSSNHDDIRTNSSNNFPVSYQVTSEDASVLSLRNIAGFPDLAPPEPFLSLSPKSSAPSSKLSNNNSESSGSEDELILNIGNGHMRRNQSEQTQKSQTFSLNSNGSIQSPINLHLKRSSISSQSFGNSSPRPSGTNLSHMNMINENNIVMSNFVTGEIDTRALLKEFLEKSPNFSHANLHKNKSNENDQNNF